MKTKLFVILTAATLILGGGVAQACADHAQHIKKASHVTCNCTDTKKSDDKSSKDDSDDSSDDNIKDDHKSDHDKQASKDDDKKTDKPSKPKVEKAKTTPVTPSVQPAPAIQPVATQTPAPAPVAAPAPAPVQDVPSTDVNVCMKSC